MSISVLLIDDKPEAAKAFWRLRDQLPELDFKDVAELRAGGDSVQRRENGLVACSSVSGDCIVLLDLDLDFTTDENSYFVDQLGNLDDNLAATGKSVGKSCQGLFFAARLLEKARRVVFIVQTLDQANAFRVEDALKKYAHKNSWPVEFEPVRGRLDNIGLRGEIDEFASKVREASQWLTSQAASDVMGAYENFVSYAAGFMSLHTRIGNNESVRVQLAARLLSMSEGDAHQFLKLWTEAIGDEIEVKNTLKHAAGADRDFLTVAVAILFALGAQREEVQKKCRRLRSGEIGKPPSECNYEERAAEIGSESIRWAIQALAEAALYRSALTPPLAESGFTVARRALFEVFREVFEDHGPTHEIGTPLAAVFPSSHQLVFTLNFSFDRIRRMVTEAAAELTAKMKSGSAWKPPEGARGQLLQYAIISCLSDSERQSQLLFADHVARGKDEYRLWRLTVSPGSAPDTTELSFGTSYSS